ncbi:ATP-dependent DNA helicase RecG [Candidatus Roizmanbacteria bacterium RIFCSPLOWO2_01_FULL_38_12]|uniref:Probable DNA 3'-5' helicase RecG n=1 Tax=Candidatus Roizmanbacteria bacterium RIFCSPLOWO2_01_FULL_38_12 TaxID=1802061 RepID=A0A1F7IUZ8_9BACT|nr:MAG: ATP-dependent DNA helicase RecG [Candidatus Roizmanbacteria bacterium RIFCSPHIGHO2_01_FULL_38_15]OGK35037.1 MAG: ATP-dependent DNA helicase RecG [Candidatus Roizmanbacteria bacterium RIFCSPHIGHO2_12_FULL_38_13]OGK47192.1 MAG: ATP-dependent DNA helicase RecG [Candidatus Roizmanbacteria bacterium RIFCSPLOWO2_01_FULL_38_12]
MFTTTSIDLLPKTTTVTKKHLKKLGIETYWDLLYYFPTRYENFSIISPISQIQPGETVTLQGQIKEIKTEYTRRRLTIQKAVLEDESGQIRLVWYNQPFLVKLLEHKKVSISGNVDTYKSHLTFTPQEYEIIYSADFNTIHTGRMVPVYQQTYGISSRTIREKIYFVLQQFLESVENYEFLPEKIVNDLKLSNEKEAITQIHFPQSSKSLSIARDRIGFDEIFIRMLSSKLVKKEWEKERLSEAFHFNTNINKKINEFISSLPFKLTSSQARSVDEIINDLKKDTPMNRFLQGDVGSGKTVVAAIAAYAGFLNGFQTLVMAPTEILAVQHYETMTKLFKDYPVKIALQTQSHKTFTKKVNNNDKYHIIIGTQALISDYVDFDHVGLVVVDEQHRFGVRQRAILKKKGGHPHLLSMTATPIPRTVSLTLYSELDLSTIDELPAGRLPIKTYVVPDIKRKAGQNWIKDKIAKNSIQVYIICPLIEESESETMKSVRAATKEYEHLKKNVFSDFRVALLHGKLKGKDKDKIMQDFKEKKYDILVSTCVVEVGIDIANATIMLIEGAERFGLAQLHQLRGRVGRAEKQSYCFLFTSTNEDFLKKRLHFFAKNSSGMKLAEYDLRIRGPGDLYGTRQHGYTELRVADLTDAKLIHNAQTGVEIFMNKYNLTDFSSLKSMISTLQIDKIARD